jgi:hypothetical protein
MKTPKKTSSNFTDGVEDEPTTEPTISIGDLPTEPLLPGFAMTDDPMEDPSIAAKLARIPMDDYTTDGEVSATKLDPVQPIGYTGLMSELNRTSESFMDARNKLAALANKSQPRQPAFVDPEILNSGLVTYESRIRVLDAWQYAGSVPRTAPVFIDRNWIGFADYDPVRDLPASPVLRVPIEGSGGTLAICRPGDFVVRQAVSMGDGMPDDVRVEVWEEQQFFKMFVPKYVHVDASHTSLEPGSNDRRTRSSLGQTDVA